MKFTDEVLKALEILTDAADNDFELYRICNLVRDLTAPPKAEVLDEKHQNFNGVTYYKKKNDHYSGHPPLHRAVFQYYCGELPPEFEIHHKDFNPANNDISNLQLLSKAEHQKVHALHNSGAFQTREFVCAFCGKRFIAQNRGNNRFCSPTCRRNFKHTQDLVERQCARCGKTFLADKYSKVRCCSVSCAQRLRQIDSYETKECLYCGKVFTVLKKYRQKYCCRECADKGKSAARRIEKLLQVQSTNTARLTLPGFNSDTLNSSNS